VEREEGRISGIKGERGNWTYMEQEVILAAVLSLCLSSSSSASPSPLRPPSHHHPARRIMGMTQHQGGCEEKAIPKYDEGAKT